MPRGKLLNGLVTQQKVLRAAVALFLEKGYTRTTTGEIAKAAGIGQSSFFHVFPSKEALLLELDKRMFKGFTKEELSLLNSFLNRLIDNISEDAPSEKAIFEMMMKSHEKGGDDNA